MAGIFDLIDALLNGGGSPVQQAGVTAPGTGPFAGPETAYRPDAPTNRRDAAMIAQNLPNTQPSPQPQQDSGGALDPILNGFARFFQGHSLASGIANVLDPTDSNNAAEKSRLDLSILRDKARLANLVPVGDADSGVFYDPITKQVVQPPPEAIQAWKEIANAKARANAASTMHNVIGAQPVRGPNGEIGYSYIDNGGQAHVSTVGGGEVTGDDAKKFDTVSEANTDNRLRVTNNTKYSDQLGAAADSATQMLSLSQRFRSAAQAGGPGVVGDLYRWMAQTTGMDIGNLNLADVQTRQTVLRQMETFADDAFKGTGPITDSERRIIRETLPQLGTDPRALTRIADALESGYKKTMDVQQAWNNYALTDPDHFNRRQFDAAVSGAWRNALTEAGPNGDKLGTKAWSGFLNKFGVESNYTPAPPPGPRGTGGNGQAPQSQSAPAVPGGVQTTPSGRKYQIDPGTQQQPNGSVIIPLNQQGGVGGPEGMPLPPRAAALPQREQFAPRSADLVGPSTAPVVQASEQDPAIYQAARARSAIQQLTSLSRATPEGQAFNKSANDLRTMLRNLKNKSPEERRAVLEALAKQGLATY